MSVLGVKPGEMGNSIMLSRLEKGCTPVTVHIPTSKQQVTAEVILGKIKMFRKILNNNTITV